MRLAAGPLGDRSFRLLAGGQFMSTIGDYCYAVALPWLVLSNRGGTVLLGVVLACYGVPRMVLIPVGGVLSDKVGPRTVMLVADGARCVLVAALAVLAVRHTASLATLGPLAAFIGAGEGLFIPASFAIMPRSCCARSAVSRCRWRSPGCWLGTSGRRCSSRWRAAWWRWPSWAG